MLFPYTYTHPVIPPHEIFHLISQSHCLFFVPISQKEKQLTKAAVSAHPAVGKGSYVYFHQADNSSSCSCGRRMNAAILVFPQPTSLLPTQPSA